MSQLLEREHVNPAPGALESSRDRTRRVAFPVVSGLLVAAFMLAALYPLWRMVYQLFFQAGKPTLSAFRQFAHAPYSYSSIVDTTIVVAISALLALAVGGTLAFINERTDARMGAITDFLPFLPFLIPAVAATIGWVLLLSPRSGYANVFVREQLAHIGIHLQNGPFNISGYPGMILLYVINLVPFAFLIISAGIRSMNSDLEAQSRVCGASKVRTLVKVTVPAIKPSLAGAFLLTVWFGYGMYSVPSILTENSGIHIMSVQIVTYLTAGFPPQYGSALVMSLAMLVPIGLVWYAQTKILKQGKFATLSGRTAQATRVELGVWKWPLRLIMLGYIFVVSVLPLIALILVATTGYWNPSVTLSQLRFARIINALSGDPQTQLALKDSFELALVGATVGIAVAALVSVLFVHSRRRATRVADGAMKLPVIISHLVLAVGFLLAFAGAPFHLAGTWTLLALAYVAMFMPQGTLTTDAAAGQVGRDLSEAAAIYGAGRWRVFRTVYLPLMVPSIAIGWAMLFVFILGDLEVSSILAGASNPTIGMQTLNLFDQGGYASVASLALLLTVVSTVVVTLVLFLARRTARWSGARNPQPQITAI